MQSCRCPGNCRGKWRAGVYYPNVCYPPPFPTGLGPRCRRVCTGREVRAEGFIP